MFINVKKNKKHFDNYMRVIPIWFSMLISPKTTWFTGKKMVIKLLLPVLMTMVHKKRKRENKKNLEEYMYKNIGGKSIPINLRNY